MPQQDQGQQRQQDQNQQHAGNKPGPQIDVSQFDPQQLSAAVKRTWTASQISQLCQMLQD